MASPTLVLYDLHGAPMEVEHVTAVLWYDSSLQYTVEKPGQEPFNIAVPLHRVHEVRYG